MKKNITVFVILLSVLITACAPKETSSMPTYNNSRNSSPESLSPTESVQQPVPEVGTTLPQSSVTPTSDSNGISSDSQPSASTITFADGGKTFYYHPGDSFLLNLGDEIYEWSATVEDQNVIALRVGVMVIKGAQGLYDALTPGTTTLTAVGDPLCRKASPPCGTPTILFKVTIVVE